MDEIILESNKGQIVLGSKTLLFAIDETGHEDLNDPNCPVFGFGGCGCMVRDYSRLIEKPWELICEKYFTEVERPMHATDLRKPSKEQIDILNRFFTTFEFFRVATIASKKTINMQNYETIKIMANILLNRLCDVGKWADFNRVVIIFEESQRIEMEIMNSLVGKNIDRGSEKIPIELCLMSKSSSTPALEVADFIVHTAGRQTRHRITKNNDFLPDFTAIFKTVDSRLTSFMEITKIEDK